MMTISNRPRRHWRIGAPRFAVAIVALGVVSCDWWDFLGPDDDEDLDEAPPEIVRVWPAFNVPLNDVRVSFQVVDNVVRPVSGIHLSGIKVTSSTGTILAATPSTTLDVYDVDVTSLPDGPTTLALEISDRTGNKTAGVMQFFLARKPPVVTANVPATASTNLPNGTFDVTGQISSLSGLSSANAVRIRQACNASAPLVPEGTTPGTVSQNTTLLSPSAQFSAPVTVNGPPDASRPATENFCVEVSAADAAVTRYGTQNPNGVALFFPVSYTFQRSVPQTGTITGQVILGEGTPFAGVTVSIGGRTTTTDAQGRYTFTDVLNGTYVVSLVNIPSSLTCDPGPTNAVVDAGKTVMVNFTCRQPDFFITTQLSYGHGVGVTGACLDGTVTEAMLKAGDPAGLEALTGAMWSISWSGPGLVGSAQRTGTLDANNRMFDRQTINRFGTYTATLTVTANGTTKTVMADVTVVAAQGTCPPP